MTITPKMLCPVYQQRLNVAEKELDEIIDFIEQYLALSDKLYKELRKHKKVLIAMLRQLLLKIDAK